MRRIFYSLMRATGRALTLRGLVAAPAAISMSGLVTAVLCFYADQYAPDFIAKWGLQPSVSQAVLSTLSGAAMTALGLVYSLILVVFTLAAGSIAPRLLERFSSDRISKAAIGVLGALFFHSLLSLALAPDQSNLAAPAVACLMAFSSIMLLVVFVDRVAKRVTIDEEIAGIAKELDGKIALAASRSSKLNREDLILPRGREVALEAPVSGYLNSLDTPAIAALAEGRGGIVDFHIAPGEHILEGAVYAHVIADDPVGLAADVRSCTGFSSRRTQDGDMQFVLSLVLEVALRALSPGVNDSFTAITCIDRLASSFAKAGRLGLNPGVYTDSDGNPRVIIPGSGLADLMRFAFTPIRQCCRDNHLVAMALISALRRLTGQLSGAALDEAERQIALTIEEAQAGGAIEADIAALKAA